MFSSELVDNKGLVGDVFNVRLRYSVAMQFTEQQGILGMAVNKRCKIPNIWDNDIP